MSGFSERRRRLFLASGRKFSAFLFHGGEGGGKGSASFSYFSGCSADGAYLVLKRKGGIMLVHGMNYRQAREGSAYPVRKLGKKPAEDLRKACGKGSIGFAPHEMSAARLLALRRKAKLRLVDAGEAIGKVRGRKGRGEVREIAAATKAARGILDSLVPWECKTERELSLRLKMLALERGFEAAFEPVVAAGRNSSKPHHKPGNARLGNFVLVDFGVRGKGGYCSDLTRCYFRGKRGKEREAYEKCKSAFFELLGELPECSEGKDAAAIAEKLLKRHSMPKPPHTIGHGIGLEVHEWPRLWKKSRDSLEAAVLAIEPAAYFKGFGVRYEDIVRERKGKWKRI